MRQAFDAEGARSASPMAARMADAHKKTSEVFEDFGSWYSQNRAGQLDACRRSITSTAPIELVGRCSLVAAEPKRWTGPAAPMPVLPSSARRTASDPRPRLPAVAGIPRRKHAGSDRKRGAGSWSNPCCPGPESARWHGARQGSNSRESARARCRPVSGRRKSVLPLVTVCLLVTVRSHGTVRTHKSGWLHRTSRHRRRNRRTRNCGLRKRCSRSNNRQTNCSSGNSAACGTMPACHATSLSGSSHSIPRHKDHRDPTRHIAYGNSRRRSPTTNRSDKSADAMAWEAFP